MANWLRSAWRWIVGDDIPSVTPPAATPQPPTKPTNPPKPPEVKAVKAAPSQPPQPKTIPPKGTPAKPFKSSSPAASEAELAWFGEAVTPTKPQPPQGVVPDPPVTPSQVPIDEVLVDPEDVPDPGVAEAAHLTPVPPDPASEEPDTTPLPRVEIGTVPTPPMFSSSPTPPSQSQPSQTSAVSVTPAFKPLPKTSGSSVGRLPSSQLGQRISQFSRRPGLPKPGK